MFPKIAGFPLGGWWVREFGPHWNYKIKLNARRNHAGFIFSSSHVLQDYQRTFQQIRTRRHWYDLKDCRIISPSVCYKLLQILLDLKSEPVEKFGIISLNTKNKITGIHIIGTGSIDKLYIEPREVFMAAMINNAKAIIAFHNHPSGEPEPSPGDIFLTQRLKEAGRIMCIELLDHVITGERDYYSLREKGLM